MHVPMPGLGRASLVQTPPAAGCIPSAPPPHHPHPHHLLSSIRKWTGMGAWGMKAGANATGAPLLLLCRVNSSTPPKDDSPDGKGANGFRLHSVFTWHASVRGCVRGEGRERANRKITQGGYRGMADSLCSS
jgi:hypothetical protein